METSQFSQNQNVIANAEPLDVGGATCECFKVKLYGKQHFLKRLKPELRTDPRYVAALHKEFEIGYNLDHPHLVRYAACGDDYLLTEFIDGMTLAEFAETNPTFFKNKANVDNLLSSLLDVLDYLHSHQIVHLDLKPDNILITRVGNELKLTDLGFCYTDTFTDTMGRTDSFAAPEQLNDDMVDHRTDIYALGRIIATLPCANRYSKVIERCTKTRKEDRYQSAAELKKDLSKPRAKWTIITTLIACIIAFAAWWLNSKQTVKSTQQTLAGDTTAHIVTTSTEAVKDSAIEKAKKDVDSMVKVTADEALKITQVNNSPAHPITIDNSTSITSHATAPPKQAIPSEETLRSELLAVTRPIYDKYLKQYESATTIDPYDTDFREARKKCDDEIADKLFLLWDTKYRPMGVLESTYNPIAVKVINHYREKYEIKFKY